MSKTKGNVIDPIEIVKTYGTDAVRFTLASMASPGTDIAFNVARTDGYRAFANKIWNAARFIFMNVDKAAEIGTPLDITKLGGMPRVEDNAPLEDLWIVDSFERTTARVNASLEKYRYDVAANEIYQFFWGSFCDAYIESVKHRLDFLGDKAQATSALTTLLTVFEASLRVLSPFMPFITEEIWQQLYEGKPPVKSIAVSTFPQTPLDPYAMQGRPEIDVQLKMIFLLALKTEVLSLRKEVGVEEKAQAPIYLYCASEFFKNVIEENRQLFARLAKISGIKFVANASMIPIGLSRRVGTDFEVAVDYEKPRDVPAERERLTKDIAKYEKGLAAAERQLGNEVFLSRAPAHIVEGLKKQEAETRLLLEKAQAALAALPES
jgi:valyl-tRNA synthetase